MTTDQTKSVLFHTNTTINPITWEMQGISVKEGENRVGKFGTGACYAIAVFLRTGHSVEIHCGENHWLFSLQKMEFRGQEFQRVTCNGKELSFTTLYGQNWTPLMAYRELVSNTMDEDGIWFAGDTPMPDGTSIIVTGPDIGKCLEDHDKMFVGDREPIAESDSLRVYHGDGTIFYRGVKVAEVPKAHYSYELLCDVDLTEDRTLSNMWTIRWRIGYAVCNQIRDKKLIEHILTAGGFEKELDYDNHWGEEFTEVVSELFEKRMLSLPPSVVTKHRRNSPSAAMTILEFNEDEKLMLEKAQEFLAAAGYPCTHIHRKVASDATNLVAFVDKKVVHLTQESFDKGLFELVTTLFEERAHAEHGFDDYSHAFQTFLIREVISQARKRLKVAL